MLSNSSAQLLSAFESCARRGHWSVQWASQRLSPAQMVSEAIREALTATEPPYGEIAGSAILQLAEDRGIETNTHRIYDSVQNHAALADILVSAIRKPEDKPWLIPEPSANWSSSCFLSPDSSTLRRIVIASHWSDDRKLSECSGWFTAGEIAHYELPMQLVVLIIGQMKDGLRRGPWSTGMLHPRNKKLRFRKKSRETTEVFNDRWIKIMREDHAEISRETWLESMLADGVLQEVCFRIDIPVPESTQLRRIRDLAQRQWDRLASIRQTPEPQLSTCHFPIPCPFLRVCPDREPSEKTGYLGNNNK